MRTLLSTTALTLALLAGGAGAGFAQSSTGGGASTGAESDKGGTTGMMTTTPRDASDDAVGTRGGTMATTTTGDAAGTATTTGRLGSDSPFYSMRGEQIVGKTLYGADGEAIGEIDNVVMTRGGGGPEAVVGVGGFLGVGERDVSIPLSQIQMQGDRLTTSMTKEGIGQMQAYDEGRYEPWAGDRTLGSAE
jgi:sporulation protein YlmC with PRC-barrel domain